MTTQRHMTPARRLRIWEAAKGLCGVCGEPVALVDADIDHRIGVWLSRDDTDANLRPLHRETCHRPKTKLDVAIIAKVKRILAREEGTRRPRKQIQSRGFAKVKTAWPKRKFTPRDQAEAKNPAWEIR